MCGSVPRQHSLAGTRSDRASFTFGKVTQNLQHIFGRPRDQDFFVWREELAQPRPRITDDRRSAGRSLEQPHAWRVAGADHVGASHVQGEALRVVKAAVELWLEMDSALDVLRPADVLRIHWAGDDE